jgi:hypothetical protein
MGSKKEAGDESPASLSLGTPGGSDHPDVLGSRTFRATAFGVGDALAFLQLIVAYTFKV